MAKIAVIWPVFPWRWWIAHHTNRLINTLFTSHVDVLMVSFLEQFPKFLYPGKSQKEPTESVNPLLMKPNFLLNPLNPITWLITIKFILQKKRNTVIFKYWHPFFVPCFTCIAWFLRRKKVQTVVIIENLLPHERHFWDMLLTRIFFSQIDKFITQSDIVHGEFNESFPGRKEIMIPHPVYDQFGPPVPQDIARDKLNLPRDKTLLLFFGFIRPYKGLDLLLEILPDLIVQRPEIHLVIAGECFGDFQPYQDIIDKYDLKGFVTIHLGYIANEMMPYYFWSCDLLVMPYRHMTNSGIENIWKIYAHKTLVTVGATSNMLKENIQKTLGDDLLHQNRKKMDWESYSLRLNFFLHNQN